jgi:hypothetical protein
MRSCRTEVKIVRLPSVGYGGCAIAGLRHLTICLQGSKVSRQLRVSFLDIGRSKPVLCRSLKPSLDPLKGTDRWLPVILSLCDFSPRTGHLSSCALPVISSRTSKGKVTVTGMPTGSKWQVPSS